MEFVVLWLLFGIFSAVIASSKNRNGCAWFVIGCLLGPFGLLVAVLPAAEAGAEIAHHGTVGAEMKCPFCAETIKVEAIVCRFCGRDLPSRSGEPHE